MKLLISFMQIKNLVKSKHKHNVLAYLELEAAYMML